MARHDTGRAATRAVELAQRDAAIRSARASGASIDDLAAEHGISRRQVQRVVAGTRTPRRAAPTAAEFAAVAADPVAELESLLGVHTDVLVELEELCRATQHDGVRLGALRARADLATQRFAIFRNVPALRDEASSRELLAGFVRVLEQHRQELPSVLVDDLTSVIAELDTHRPTAPTQEAQAA